MKKTFGQKLKTARLAAYVTLFEASSAADVQLNTWWRWENDEFMPNAKLLPLIAKAVKTNPAELMQW